MSRVADIDLSGLDMFREGASETARGSQVRPWSPVARRSILCFDQSISNTGWALIVGKEVLEGGNVKHEGSTGIGDMLDVLPEIYFRYLELINYYSPDLVAHESPPAGGGRMRSPESSVVTAAAVRIAAADNYSGKIPVKMIQSQKAKKRWTGSARATKAEVKKALLQMVPSLENMKPMNQAITDALAVGMLASEEE